MYIKGEVSGRRRRRHSAQFKARMIQECLRPGVSMAAVALANGLNANMLRNWVARRDADGAAALPDEPAQMAAPAQEEFIALAVERPQPPGTGGDIRIELRRGATTVTVNWPVSAAEGCATWLRAWLR